MTNRFCTPRPLPPQYAAEHARIAAEYRAARERSHPHPRPAAALAATLWHPGQSLRVAFAHGTAAERRSWMQAADEWSRYANLHFVQVSRGAAEIRVGFDPAGGSWSYLGNQALALPQDQPTANSGWPHDYVRDLHENGHILGFEHEHARPDRPFEFDEAAVDADLGGPPNYWSPQEVRDQVITPIAAAGLVVTPFDVHSVMIYGAPKNWFQPPFPGIPWPTGLTEYDRQMAAREYPR